MSESHRMLDHQALRRAFQEYAEALIGPYDIGQVLYRLSDQIVEVLGVGGVGVSIAGTDGLEFVTATDERVTRAEEHQIQTGSGPCHQAVQEGRRVVSDDLAADDRWPPFAGRAVELGCRAAVGIPMPSREQIIGALDIYHYEPYAWPEEELDAAQLLADMAAGYIINARQLHESRELSEQLQRALDSRVVIEQAKGIIAGRHDIDLAEAFGRLRTHARSSRLPLHDVAREVVERTLEL